MLWVYRDGQDHRSLSQLLKDLEKRSQGTAPGTDKLGSVGNPFNVVVKVHCARPSCIVSCATMAICCHCFGSSVCVVAKASV